MTAGGEFDLGRPCPVCDVPVGDHTLRGYRECAKGLDYYLPFAGTDGALQFDGIDGDVAGEVVIAAIMLDTPGGKVPGLQFRFVSPGQEAMSRVSHRPMHLVGHPQMLREVRQLVSAAVDEAILSARRANRR